MKIEALEQVKKLIREGRVSRDEVVRQLYVELHTENASYSQPIQPVTMTSSHVVTNTPVVERVAHVPQSQSESVIVENVASRPAPSQNDVIEQAKAAAKAKSQQEIQVEEAAARLREKHEQTYSRPQHRPVEETAHLSEIEKHVKGMTKKVIESEIPLIQNHWAPELTIVGETINREVYLDLLIQEARKK